MCQPALPLSYKFDWLQFCPALRMKKRCVDNIYEDPQVSVAGGGHADVARQLLAAGASVGLTNEREESAASLALQQGHISVARQLLEASKDDAEKDVQVHLETLLSWHKLWDSYCPVFICTTTCAKPLLHLLHLIPFAPPFAPLEAVQLTA